VDLAVHFLGAGVDAEVELLQAQLPEPAGLLLVQEEAVGGEADFEAGLPRLLDHRQAVGVKHRLADADDVEALRAAEMAQVPEEVLEGVEGHLCALALRRQPGNQRRVHRAHEAAVVAAIGDADLHPGRTAPRPKRAEAPPLAPAR
jgi:hypothetical protein